mmetsp:Transcript_83547/g.240059  ORF Transcript_83547/g.240059 Transcript_83547/m.240059 type:complete len:121 (+) Transcript_83547:712-1074(+)
MRGAAAVKILVSGRKPPFTPPRLSASGLWTTAVFTLNFMDTSPLRAFVNCNPEEVPTKLDEGAKSTEAAPAAAATPRQSKVRAEVLRAGPSRALVRRAAMSEAGGWCDGYRCEQIWVLGV